MTQRPLFFAFVAALLVAAVPGPIRADAAPADLILVAADCSRAASKASAQTGGRVLSVSSRNQDGRAVCVVTVLVPAEGGGRPRKKTVVIPQ